MSFPLMPCVVENYNNPVVTFTHSASSSSNLVTYTFTAVALGAEAPDRYIVVAAHTDVGGGLLPISATVNGVDATLVVNRAGVGLFIALVPTGTSVTVTTTFSGTATRSAMGVWSITGRSREAASFTNSNGGTGTSVTTSVAASKGEAVIAAISHANTTGFTWSGGTERYDVSNGNSTRMSGADTSATVDTAAQSFTATAVNSAAWSAVSASFK